MNAAARALSLGTAAALSAALLASAASPQEAAQAQGTNNQPRMNASSYAFHLLPGTDGSSTSATLGTLTATDLDTGDTLAFSLRPSDAATTVYMVQDATGTSSDALYSVNTTTGTASQVGAADNFGLGSTAAGPSGLAWHNGKLYMTGEDSARLYVVDPFNGTATVVGVASGFGVGQTEPVGLASHGGKLYMIGSSPDRLYTLDTATGLARPVGQAQSFGSLNVSSPRGLASHGGKLYAAAGSLGYVVTIDATTGVAARLGTTTPSAVPDGLASRGGTLYAVAASSDALYSVDTDTSSSTLGSVTKVGSGLGGPTDPTGLAGGYAQPSDFEISATVGTVTYTGSSAPAGEHTLYGQVRDSKASDGTADTVIDDAVPVTVLVANRGPSFSARRYSLTIHHDSDGRTTPVPLGTASATDPENDALAYTLAGSDPADRMYLVGDTADGLFTLNSTTGSAGRIGSALAFGAGETSPRALAWHVQQLYMIGGANNSLYTVDIATGEVALVATRDQLVGSGSAASLSGVASHKGRLYVTTVSPGGLHVVDLDGPSGTQIGTDGFGSLDESDPSAIASHTGALYMVGADTNKLYRVNTSTGAATAVNSAASEFGVAETEPAGLASHGGLLYMTGGGNGRLYTLNTLSGTATQRGSLSDFGAGETAPAGIASGYTAPTGFAIASSTGTVSYTGPPIGVGVFTLIARVSDSRSPAGSADTAVDQAAQITVTVPGHKPSFNPSSYSFNLLPGTDGSSTGKTVGTVSADDDEGHTLSYRLQPSDPSTRMYFVGGATDALHTLDNRNSTVMQVGDLTQFGEGVGDPAALAWHNGELIMAGATRSYNGFFLLDTTVGRAALAATVEQLTGSDKPIGGIASHNGKLYATTTGPGRLYRIDLDELTATQVGSDDFGTLNETEPRGLASLGGKLYMVGSTTDKLYEIASSGTATQVGSASAFGAVNESEPAGLSAHANKLYMTGASNDWLYTLSHSTGVATRVGSQTQFGVTEGSPSGIASGYSKPSTFSMSTDGTLRYTGSAAVGGSKFTLYAQVHDGVDSVGGASTATDDTATIKVTVRNAPPAFARDSYRFTMSPGLDGSSTAATVGSTSASDPDTGDTLTYSLRGSDPSSRMYATGLVTAALYTIDSTASTLKAVRVNPDAHRFDATESGHGLAWHHNNLFMLGDIANALYIVNPGTGAAGRVGTAVNFGVGETRPLGLASHGETLYMVGDDTDALYAVDPHTGIATRIGNATRFGAAQQSPVGLASVGSVLYMIANSPSALYTVNTSTGVATKVNTTSLGKTFGAMGEHNGTLYVWDRISPGGMHTISTAGVLTKLTTQAGLGVGETLTGIASGYEASSDFSIDSTGTIKYSGSSATGGDEHTLYAQVRDSKSPNDTADTAIDDTATVIVRVENRAPSFAKASYSAVLAADTDGSTNAVSLVSVKASDPESDTITYSLRPDTAANRMYMTGWDTQSLYNLNSSTGAAGTRVGSANIFGLNEAMPTGIAWHNCAVYMLGRSNDALYSVDTATGLATLIGKVSSAAGFLTGGLASHDGELYMVGGGESPGVYRLYTLDPETGAKVGVGTATQFGISSTQPAGLASHSGKLYMADATNDALYTLNTASGTATQVGTASQFGTVSESAPAGLASYSGSLYMLGRGGDKLYKLNTSTGNATAVGSSTSFGISETQPYGLIGDFEAPSGFAIDSSSGALTYTGTGETAGSRFELCARASDGKSRAGATDTTPDAVTVVRVVVADTPAAPTAAPEAEPGDRAVSLSWTAGSDGGAPVTKWQYLRRSRSSLSSPWPDWSASTWQDMSGTGPTTTSFTVSGLSNGSYYQFKVRAVNGAGSGAESAASDTRRAGAPGRPAAVTLVSGYRSLAVSWPAPARNGSAISDYDVQYQQAHDSSPQDHSHVGVSRRTAITGLCQTVGSTVSCATTRVRVRAKNAAFGEGRWSPWTLLTPSAVVGGPLPPTTFTAVSGNRSATLTAALTTDADGGSPVTGWQYRFKTTGNAYPQTWTNVTDDRDDDADGLRTSLSGLVNGTTHTFQVRAVNSVGNGTASHEVSVKPAAPPPSGGQQQPGGGAPPPPGSRFTDTAGSVHEADIRAIAARGITLGCNPEGTRYCPDQPVTRAQMASFLTRALELTPPTDPDAFTFTDTTGNYHQADIRAIAARGITLGCNPEGTRYCPDQPVTRAQMASFLARALKLSA